LIIHNSKNCGEGFIQLNVFYCGQLAHNYTIAFYMFKKPIVQIISQTNLNVGRLIGDVLALPLFGCKSI